MQHSFFTVHESESHSPTSRFTLPNFLTFECTPSSYTTHKVKETRPFLPLDGWMAGWQASRHIDRLPLLHMRERTSARVEKQVESLLTHFVFTNVISTRQRAIGTVDASASNGARLDEDRTRAGLVAQTPPATFFGSPPRAFSASESHFSYPLREPSSASSSASSRQSPRRLIGRSTHAGSHGGRLQRGCRSSNLSSFSQGNATRAASAQLCLLCPDAVISAPVS